MFQVREFESGKFEAVWPVITVRTRDGHYVTGRAATVAALAPGAAVVNRAEARVAGSREYCEAQAD